MQSETRIKLASEAKRSLQASGILWTIKLCKGLIKTSQQIEEKYPWNQGGARNSQNQNRKPQSISRQFVTDFQT